MTLPQLTPTEHIAAIVSAAGLTLLVAPAVVPTWVKWLGLIGGVVIGGGSFLIRSGWKPSISS